MTIRQRPERAEVCSGGHIACCRRGREGQARFYDGLGKENVYGHGERQPLRLGLRLCRKATAQEQEQNNMHHYPKGNASCCDEPASFSRLIQIHSFTCFLPPFLSPSPPPFSHKPRARLIISAKKIVAATGIVTATTFLPEGRGAKRGIMRGGCREGGREGEREGEMGGK